MPVSSTEDSNDILNLVRAAADELRRAVAAFAPGGQVSTQLIAAAFAAARHISEARLVAHESIEDAAGLRDAVNDYRSALQQWHQQLPRVHGWLLAERARLERRRAHTDSVSSWLQASRQAR